LAIRQAIRAKLYNKCLLFVLKKSLSPIFSYNTYLLRPTNTYASVPSLVLAWEPSSHLSPPFSLPHQH
jgi:hypothetical protein